MSLGKFLASAALLAVSFAGLPAASQAADAVAMVTDRQGKAQIVEDGRARPLALLDYLRPDAELKLGRGASVTLVYFTSGTQYVLAGEGGARIRTDRPAVTGKAKLTSNAMRQGALVANARKETAQGALVMKAVPPPVWPMSPADTRVLDPRPTLRWDAKRVAPPYRVTLADDRGERVAGGETRATRYVLPAGVTLRDGARYTWRVEGRVKDGATQVSEASFEVATAAEREQIKRAQPAAGAAFSERVTYAAVLDGMGFRDAARAEWRRLAAERKGDVRLRAKANMEH